MNNKSSFFYYSQKEYILWCLIKIILNTFSLTIIKPILLYIEYKKEAESTLIDGQQLYFKGRLKEIILLYYIWLFITILIILIVLIIINQFYYRLTFYFPISIIDIAISAIITFLSQIFLNINIKKWKYYSTYIQNSHHKSFYKGHLFLVILSSVIRKILTIISVGLFYPTIKIINYRYECRGIIISNNNLTSDYHPLMIYKIWIKSLLLIIITLGFYWPFVSFKLKKEMIEHLHFDNNKTI